MSKKEQQDPMELFIQSCLNDESIKQCKSEDEVVAIIDAALQKDYKGKAPVAKIRAIAEDAAESVWLRMI